MTTYSQRQDNRKRFHEILFWLLFILALAMIVQFSKEVKQTNNSNIYLSIP